MVNPIMRATVIREDWELLITSLAPKAEQIRTTPLYALAAMAVSYLVGSQVMYMEQKEYGVETLKTLHL